MSNLAERSFVYIYARMKNMYMYVRSINILAH